MSTTRDGYRNQAATAMSEASLQARVIHAATQLGYLVYHTHDSRRSHKGWPDLVLAHPGWQKFLIRELKSEKGRITREQQAWLSALTTLGIDAGIWRPRHLLEGTIHKQLTARSPQK